MSGNNELVRDSGGRVWPGRSRSSGVDGAVGDEPGGPVPRNVARGGVPSSADVASLAFSPDGSTLATGDFGWTTGLWAVSTGSSRMTLIGQHTDEVTSVSFSPDGRLLASGSGHPRCICGRWRSPTRPRPSKGSATPSTATSRPRSGPPTSPVSHPVRSARPKHPKACWQSGGGVPQLRRRLVLWRGYQPPPAGCPSPRCGPGRAECGRVRLRCLLELRVGGAGRFPRGGAVEDGGLHARGTGSGGGSRRRRRPRCLRPVAPLRTLPCSPRPLSADVSRLASSPG
ncbi:WD40 repeat domain-containing protein [Streptomyces sp. NPDC001606]